MNQKKNKSKISKTPSKRCQVTKMNSANKISAHKEVLNKTIDIIYTKMIQSKNSRNYTWRRSFIDLLVREKGIDIKQLDLVPKSINEMGSMTLKNYKFWFLYLENMKRNLNFIKLLHLTRNAMSYLIKSKEIKMMKILFAAMIRELKVTDREIENYCKTNRIPQKKKDKYYEYLLFNGFCNFDKGDKVVKKLKIENPAFQQQVDKDKDDNQIKQEDIIIDDIGGNDQCNNEFKAEAEAEAKALGQLDDNINVIEVKNADIIIPMNISESDIKTELTPVQKKKLESSPIIKVFDEKSISDDIEKIKSLLKEERDMTIEQTSSNKQIKDCEITPKQNPLIEHNIYTQIKLQMNDDKVNNNINTIQLNESMNVSFEQKKYLSFNEPLTDSNGKNSFDEDNEDNKDKDSIEDSYIKYLKEIAAKRSHNIDPIMNLNVDDSIHDDIEPDIIPNENKAIQISTPNNRKSMRLLEALTPLLNSKSQSKVHIFRFKYNIK